MKSRKAVLILTSGAVIIAGVLAFRASLLQTETAGQGSLTQGSGRIPAAIDKAQGVDIAKPSKGQTALPTGLASAGVQGQAEAAKTKIKKPSSFQKEMDDYAYLKKKVFLSDDEKSEKQRLIQNVQFLRSLADRLRSPSKGNPEGVSEKNLALDVLFESLVDNQSSAAGEVLRDLIQDVSIENPNIDKSVRKELAGIKAEILYQWSALDPSKISDLQRWLPGPVSLNLWKNVRAAQNNNVAESRAELRR